MIKCFRVDTHYRMFDYDRGITVYGCDVQAIAYIKYSAVSGVWMCVYNL